jgi:sRNA-binding carbon storage regulator CsrA
VSDNGTLIITRRVDQRIELICGDQRIEIFVAEIKSKQEVRIGICAPKAVKINRNVGHDDHQKPEPS